MIELPPRTIPLLQFFQRKKKEKGKTGMPRAQPLPRLSGKDRATVSSVLPRIALLAVVVGIVGQGAEALTIEETGAWQACVRNPSFCRTLVLSGRGLTGSIPASICDFVNLQKVYVSGCLHLCFLCLLVRVQPIEYRKPA